MAEPTSTLPGPNRGLAIDVPPSVRRWLGDGVVTANVGFDLAFERQSLLDATAAIRELLSIRVSASEALIGPRWVPGQAAACAGCAESRMRQAVDHPLAERGDVNASPRAGWPAALEVLVEVGLQHLGERPLEPGEMLAVGLSATRRHRVRRSPRCPLCGTTGRPDNGPLPLLPAGRYLADGPQRPPRLVLRDRPSPDAVPLRAAPSRPLDARSLRGLVDGRVGPVLQVQRDNRAPYAMSGALLPGARAPGYGRSQDFAHAAVVAILEAYERLGAVPRPDQVVRQLSYRDLCRLGGPDTALDPATLGSYTPAQLHHPNCSVRPYHPDTPLDWAYGYQLGDGAPRLIPAEIAFYGYRYSAGPAPAALPPAAPAPAAPAPARCFAESSSGCALGSSLEEAALHALMELIERDAFLLCWCRRQPLPCIDQASLADHQSQLLLDVIDSRGFDVDLLVSTSDLELPSIWALAVNRDPTAIPATYSAAGAGPVPGDAVRAALWELAQLAARPVDWDLERAAQLVADPSQVDTIEDHVHLYAQPEMRHRVAEVRGGPVVTLDQAFPGWPQQLCQASQGDVTGALRFLLDRCAAAGMEQALVVDQSTPEHHDLGLRVARVVMPGMLPLCFGSPHQRLAGLPRRINAVARAGRVPDEADLLLDPHPFP